MMILQKGDRQMRKKNQEWEQSAWSSGIPSNNMYNEASSSQLQSSKAHKLQASSSRTSR